MEEIQAPKKERKFLKAVVNIAKVLANELVMGIARKFIGKAIDKVGNKRQGLIIASVILASTFAFAQYPATGNKQRLGYQTTGDGLLFRGRASDTMAIKSSGLNNAYFILDTVNNVVYNYIKTKGGWLFNNSDTIIVNNNFIQPIDSLFFKTSIPTNNVDTAKMRWDFDLGTVVLGMYDKVPNELGFKNFWLVKNQTGSTITKGSIVYANGTVGASGRITVAKFIANGSIDAKYLLGITAHDLTDGEDGYVISYGKIRQVNTDTFTAGAILYPSPTVAGVWTDVEPVAPNIDMPIGFCINSSVNNGTIAIRVSTGSSLRELHDVAISSPVENSSLYYKSGLWRDTTASLLLSDTAAMLTPYLRKLDTVSLSNRINLKLNISDTASMLTNYLRSGVASLTYTPLARSISTTSPLQGGGDLSTDRTLSILSASETQSGILNTTAQLIGGSKVFKHRLTADSLFFLNNTSPIPTAILGINLTGGVNSVGKFTLGNGLSITSSTLLADTNLLVTRFDTASMLIPYFKDSDTTSLNLTSRFAAKENTIISGTTGQYFRGDKTFQTLDKTAVGLSNVDNTSDANKPVSTATQTALNLKLNISDTASMLTNYLRTGVAASTYQAKLNGTGFVKASGTTISYDNSTYLTTSTAASTYLPLTGGPLTGALSGTTGTFNTRLGVGSFVASPTLFTSGSGDQEIHFTHSDNVEARKVTLRLTNNNSSFYTFGGLIYAIQGEGLNQYNRMSLGVNTLEIMHLTRFSRVGIMNNSPSYTLDVNGTFNATGNSLIGGTLGVTGATTLSAPLTVNSSAVFNEGSTDSDFRVESDGNVNMVFVDASTDRVGIGTNAPTKTLDVNGEVKIATVTATPTSLLGKDGSNVVGEVTTLTQTGLMKAGSTTENTSSVGIITVAHGLSYTPTQVLVTLAQQNSYVIVCHGKNSTNLLFTVYDSVTGNALNNVSVGFFWLAIK